jgi:hypothetical protein
MHRAVLGNSFLASPFPSVLTSRSETVSMYAVGYLIAIDVQMMFWNLGAGASLFPVIPAKAGIHFFI